MKTLARCKLCKHGFSYLKKTKPRIYCDGCRNVAGKLYSPSPRPDPDYFKRYYLEVVKPRKYYDSWAIVLDAYYAEAAAHSGRQESVDG